MCNWVYLIATNQWLYGGPCDVVPVAGQGSVKLSRNPKPRTERYDGAGGIRPATALEIIDYDLAQQTAEGQSRFDSEKLVQALAIYVAQLSSIPPATARAAILAIYRGLP